MPDTDDPLVIEDENSIVEEPDILLGADRTDPGSSHSSPPRPRRVARWYCLVSALAATAAIVLAPNVFSITLSYKTGPGSNASLFIDHEENCEADDNVPLGLWLQRTLFGMEEVKKEEFKLPHWLRWLPGEHHNQKKPKMAKTWPILLREAIDIAQTWVDPSLLRPSATTFTDLIDKVLTSTPRLLSIANLLLALTYQLHAAVADWFLGRRRELGGIRGSSEHRLLGGFLVFKLLLISAVVAPDTLDLLILLSWYTLLSFLRSLAGLCEEQIRHTAQSGQAPRSGVVQLLIGILLSDFVSAAVCVALFHGAGWGMVILLTCDCALLAADVLGFILQHIGQVLEAKHGRTVSAIEAEQIRWHQQRREAQQRREDGEDQDDENWEDMNHTRRLDRQMEVAEQQHARRLSVVDTTVFALQLLSYALTIGHFLHIWSLHGMQFTLIDGVLALHLHSALSGAGKKIAERRNLHRIARELDGVFENASQLDLRKAAAAGDVCCICLRGMSTGGVKKVGCGHLYHSSCLREVVERARSMEAARCPLCRASVMDGRQPGGSATTAPQAAGTDAAPQRGAGNDANNNARERALFRFSTEEVFPNWLPLPAFSFEVVRRPSALETAAPEPREAPRPAEPPRTPVANPVPREEPSFWRRLFVLTGAIPMSEAEEAAAVEQLVDMFPQYDRADLLASLRERRSAEAVAESILAGRFVGRARGADVPQFVAAAT